MKVVGLSALRTGHLYPQYIFLVLISVRDWVDPRAIMRSRVLCQSQIPTKTSGIQTATFRIISQSLSKPHHCAPVYYRIIKLL